MQAKSHLGRARSEVLRSAGSHSGRFLLGPIQHSHLGHFHDSLHSHLGPFHDSLHSHLGPFHDSLHSHLGHFHDSLHSHLGPFHDSLHSHLGRFLLSCVGSLSATNNHTRDSKGTDNRG
jgi:hypothetical protein